MASEQFLSSEYQEWENIVDPVKFKAVLSNVARAEQYDAALRYYAAALLQETSEGMFQAISLLKETLEALARSFNDEGIGDLLSNVEAYHRRLQNTVSLLAKEVPSHMHFVWVGGAMFGANQRDYFNIWKARAPEDFTFNIWYDPDALMAFDVSRTLIQAAKADAMRSGGDQPISNVALGQLYEERLAVLRRQAFDFIGRAQQRGLGADEARIEFLVEAFAQDKSQLLAARERYLQSHLELADHRVRLRNVREAFATHFLWSAYEREISLRGNFAAASDLVRLQAIYQDGGTYSDLDYLPPLVDEMGGVDISAFKKLARSGVLQLLLDHNQGLMPGREKSRYKDMKEHIPQEHLSALESFAQSTPSLERIFAPLTRQVAPIDLLGMGSPDKAGDKIPSLMNAYIVAQPRAEMTGATMKLIRYYYDVIEAVELHLDKHGLAWSDEGNLSVIQNMLREVGFPFTGDWALNHIWPNYETKVMAAIDGYHRDGVVPGAGGTISLTGPGALLAGSGFFRDSQYTLRGAAKIKALQHVQEGYNTATEEEMISGWIEREDPKSVWVKNEQQAWRDGKFKARYTASLQALLKPANTLTFKRGWPLVEDKPVLITAIVQRLIDQLGEPFIRAMTDKLSGDVVFASNASLSFDERRQILGQRIDDIPASVGAQHPENLNELLVHLERGSLPLEQLSPLHRVLLGGLFAAERLDSAGFEPAWQAAQALARDSADGGLFARFAAIEKTLSERQAPAFVAALARNVKRGEQSARELKVLALSRSLTLNQWGQSIAQINATAQWEYHTRILKQAAPVREQFFKAGAVSARQMPQAFLVHAAGDPGRRCYPLALLMAAAFSRGESAERALIGRVANASLAPADADSRALLLTLDELREVRMSNVGTSLGSHDLQGVIQALEAQPTSSVLLLDTGNHVLLAARVETAESTLYRFFEPNFAVYGFEQGAAMQQGIEQHLLRDGGELAKLYGLADAGDLRFNVVELNTAAIAETVLPSSLQVGSLLENSALPGIESISVWEKQSALRARSLAENARLGESLAQVDARYLTQEFDLATRQLRSEHGLRSDYVPLLDTVKSTADGRFSLTLIDARHPADSVHVNTADSRFFNVKKGVQHLVDAVSGNTGGPGADDGGSRLSFAFAIQTLVTEMRDRERQVDAGSLPTLSIALQVQVYVSYAQLAYGVVTDTVQMINLVRQVALSEQAFIKQQTSMSGRLLGRVSAGIGIGFSLINIGLDIHGLTVASNDEERSRLTTQLTFNLAALGLDVTALAVGGTVGAAASFLAVPLLGLGIGFTAIASNLGQISDKARNVGRHLLMIHDAYGLEGVERKDGVLKFAVEAVITELDLQARQVRFDSQRFFPLEPHTLGLPGYNSSPEQLHRAINIREAMSRAGTLKFGKTDDRGIESVVLPCTPQCYYGYEYQLGSSGFKPDDDLYPRVKALHEAYDGDLEGYFESSSMTLYPNILDSWKKRLEFASDNDEQRFQFFSTAPFAHILYKLLPVNKPTTITVTLDDHARYLVIPELPNEWHNLLSYEITGQSGLYQLTLTPGVITVRLSKPGGLHEVNWLIRAPWASEKQVGFGGGDLIVGGVRVVGFNGFLLLSDGELFQFDREKDTWLLVSITLSKSTPELPDAKPADMPTVLARPRTLAKANRLAGRYVPLYHFVVPFNHDADVQYTTAYYDVALDRVLYVRDMPAALREGMALGGVSGQQAWFYHPDHATVWRVDTATGRVNHAYRLLSPRVGSKVIGCEQTVDGKLRVLQEITHDEDARCTLEYLIADNSVTFVHISADYAFRSDTAWLASTWAQRLSRFRENGEQPATLAGIDVPLSTWTSAPFVGVRGFLLGDPVMSGWIRLSDERFYANDDPDDKEPVQKIMLMWDQSDNESMLFYDMAKSALIRGFSNPAGPDTALDQTLISDVAQVTQSQGRYILTRADGQMFEIDKDGAPTFIGVGTRWLDHHADWVAELPALVFEHGKRPFPVIGLSQFSEHALLAAWCVDGKLCVSQVNPGKELTLLSLTPDGQAVWFFDTETGQLYRQQFSSAEALREAFAGGSRLLHPERLPAARKVWTEWCFAEVVSEGQRLRGRTREGVNLELVDEQPARIVSLENAWARADQSGLSIQTRLKSLLAGKDHAAVLAVENSGDQYAYYLVEQEQLFVLKGRPDGEWSDFLGVKNVWQTLLFDAVDRVFYRRDSNNGFNLAASHAARDGEVLTLESTIDVDDLQPLLLDGVETLVLAFGLNAQTFRVSDEAWRQLDCIVVDRRRVSEDAAPGEHTLLLERIGSAHWLVSEARGNLLMVDPDTAQTLIIRDVEPQDGQLRVPMYLSVAIEGRDHRLNVEQLLRTLQQVQSAGEVIGLKTLIDSLTE